MRTANGTELLSSVLFSFPQSANGQMTEIGLNEQFDCIILSNFAFLPGFHIARGGKTWYASIEL